MKSRAFSLLLITVVSAIGAEPNNEAERVFLNAYLAFERGRKSEEKQDWGPALEKYEQAEKLLKEVREKYPDYHPWIVEYRAARVAEGLTRVRRSIQAGKLVPF